MRILALLFAVCIMVGCPVAPSDNFGYLRIDNGDASESWTITDVRVWYPGANTPVSIMGQLTAININTKRYATFTLEPGVYDIQIVFGEYEPDYDKIVGVQIERLTTTQIKVNLSSYEIIYW